MSELLVSFVIAVMFLLLCLAFRHSLLGLRGTAACDVEGLLQLCLKISTVLAVVIFGTEAGACISQVQFCPHNK